ncbi:unnamed protein product [Larinioides sclopetarius]|uniref:Uncharacterized protein n=1 Tax=Larinioides sclopetarius TaxID=280406 RepID=A0AAV2B0P6_9ARAC
MTEDVESIEFSNTEGTITGTWESAAVIEDSVQTKSNKRRVIKKFASWKIFKIIVFIISVISVIVQSIEFLKIYYKYPTNIVLETTVRNDFRFPAVTLCFINTVSTETFCRFNPRFCEEPSDLKEFCKENPLHCRGNTADLKIPKTGYYTNYSQDLVETAQLYLPYEDFNANRLYVKYSGIETFQTRTFIQARPTFLKCYSENLHLYQNDLKRSVQEIDFNSSAGSKIMSFELSLFKINLYYPSLRPQVFIGIHSPFVPNNPRFDGQAIYPGKSYGFVVEMDQEEHRLPPPYQTSCRDNGPSKDAKPFTNPNSYQMCRSEFSKKVFGCDRSSTMISSPDDLCYTNKSRGEKPHIYFKNSIELKKKRHICMQNCKQECLKLHYKYTVVEADLNFAVPTDFAEINIYVKNTEITVLRHVPLYGSGEIFSHIGGLAGFWLGVSVFTFTDTIEKLFWKAVYWKMNLRTRNEQSAPTSEIHLD